MGKIPSGISDGNILWTGRHDMCRVIEKGGKEGSPMDARYCVATVGPFLVGFCMPWSCEGSDLQTLLTLGRILRE